jgi:hypothetical protein
MKSMNMKEFCSYTGLTRQAAHKQIREGKRYGPFFYKDKNGRRMIDEKYVKGNMFSQPVMSAPEDIECANADCIYDHIKNGTDIGKAFNKIGRRYLIDRDSLYKYFSKKIKEDTNYPDLFDCYWGNHSRYSISDSNVDKIIKNRNDLVKNFKLKNQSKRKPYRYWRSLDHTESYTIEGSRDALIISSPYMKKPEDMGSIKGWFMLPKLYCDGAISFGFWYSENKELFNKRRDIK